MPAAQWYYMRPSCKLPSATNEKAFKYSGTALQYFRSIFLTEPSMILVQVRQNLIHEVIMTLDFRRFLILVPFALFFEMKAKVFTSLGCTGQLITMYFLRKYSFRADSILERPSSSNHSHIDVRYVAKRSLRPRRPLATNIATIVREKMDCDLTSQVISRLDTTSTRSP